MEFFVGLILGFLICYLAVKIVIWKTMREIEEHVDIDELMKELQHQTPSTINLRIEQHCGIWLAYDVMDNSFVAQGVDEKSLLTSLQSLKKTVLITQGNQALIDKLREAAR